MEKGIGWLQKLLNLQNKYGFFSIVKGLFLVLLGGYVVFFALNPKYLLERITKIQTEEHNNLIETRLRSDTEINNILSKLLSTADADRAWLIELHNGSKNLGTGLPFLYGSMRMEEVRDSIFHVDDEYSDFNLSKYKLIVKTLRDGFFYGNLEDVRLVDERLYYKFKANNVNEIALIVLYDCKETPIGLLGLSYCNGKLMQRQLVGKEIRKGGLQIASPLSLNGRAVLRMTRQMQGAQPTKA